MSTEHTATVIWQRGDQPFLDKKYSRGHTWRFDGGIEVPGSSAPSRLVPIPFSKPDAVDPEEALVAALSSCHMLFFLAFAANAGFRVDAYEDDAVGVLDKNDKGKFYMARVTLRPRVTFSGDIKPTAEDVAGLHERSHHECYVANSMRGEVLIEPPPPVLI